MGNLGFQELLIIGVVILVMFGGRKSKKELMAALGVSPEMIVTNKNTNVSSNSNVSSNANDNNMSLNVTELTDPQENNQVSNIVIISNPNLHTVESELEAEVDEDQESIVCNS